MQKPMISFPILRFEASLKYSFYRFLVFLIYGGSEPDAHAYKV